MEYLVPIDNGNITVSIKDGEVQMVDTSYTLFNERNLNKIKQVVDVEELNDEIKLSIKGLEVALINTATDEISTKPMTNFSLKHIIFTQNYKHALLIDVFSKFKNRTSVFIGGGDIVSNEIQAFRNFNEENPEQKIPMRLMDLYGQGASSTQLENHPENSFVNYNDFVNFTKKSNVDYSLESLREVETNLKYKKSEPSVGDSVKLDKVVGTKIGK